MRLLILLSVAAAVLSAGQAPIQPTVDEVSALELLNQFRADQRRTQLWIDGAVQRKEVPLEAAEAAYWRRYRLGVARPQPAVVINPALMQAARSLLTAKLRPASRQPVDWAAAMQAAGYAPVERGQAMLGVEAASLQLSFAAACLHVVGDKELRPGHTVPVFAAAGALTPEWREAGIAVSREGGKWSLAIVLGLGAAKRYIGGLVFADANRNGRCDAGEGRVGTTITYAGQSVVSGPGGVWWLALADEAAGQVDFSGDGFAAQRQMSRITVNQRIDWSQPLAADVAALKRLIKDAERDLKKDAERQRKSQAALLAATRRANVDSELLAQANGLVAPIQGEYDRTTRLIVDALQDTQQNFRSRLEKIKAPWKDSFAALFREAEDLYRLHETVVRVRSTPPERHAKEVPPVLKEIEAALERSCEPALMDALRSWQSSLEALIVAAAETEARAEETK